MNRPRVIALSVTTLAAIIVGLLLCVIKITVDNTPRQWPPRHDSEVTLVQEENYFDVLVPAPTPAPVYKEAAPAVNPEPASNKSTPAPTTGHSVADKGKAADAPVTTTSKRPSTVKQTVQEKPAQTGPSKEQLAQEEARRRANAATANAFKNASGKNNTENKGNTQGNSGSPTGTSDSYNGTGTGNVTGGWVMPRYNPVRSTVTGTIKVKVSINREGIPQAIDFQGGTPPAATDPALRARVQAEIRARRFTRHDNNAPDNATAIITYIFK